VQHRIRPSNAHDTSGGHGDLAALMQRIQSADSTAFEQLFDATVNQVYARALRITGAAADAEQVTFAAYQQLGREASQFRRSRNAPLRRLMIVTRDRALECCRKRAPTGAADFGESARPLNPGPAVDDACRGSEASLLRTTLLRLEAGQARLLCLACFDGLTVGEIAACTRLPRGTIRTSLCAALVALRRGAVGIEIR